MSESNTGLVDAYERALGDLRVNLAAERRKSARLVADMKALQVQQREEAMQEIQRLRETMHNVNEENDSLRRQKGELEQQLQDVVGQMQQNTRAAEMRSAITCKTEKNLEAQLQTADEEIQQLHSQLQHLTTTHKEVLKGLSEERDAVLERGQRALHELESVRESETRTQREMASMQQRLRSEMQRGQDLLQERNTADARLQGALDDNATHQAQLEAMKREMTAMQQRLRAEMQRGQEMQHALQRSTPINEQREMVARLTQERDAALERVNGAIEEAASVRAQLGEREARWRHDIDTLQRRLHSEMMMQQQQQHNDELQYNMQRSSNGGSERSRLQFEIERAQEMERTRENTQKQKQQHRISDNTHQHQQQQQQQRSADDLMHEIGIVERMLVSEGQELQLLESELFRLPTHSGKTLQQRKRKLGIERRIADLRRSLSEHRNFLRQNHVPGFETQRCR